MRIIATLLFIVCTTGVKAQDCNAEAFFSGNPPACADYLEGIKCVNLDVTDSYDFEGKEFVFIWNMGDGSQLEGIEVSHCYETGGAYKASLTLIDPVSKIEIKDELIVDIFIKDESRVSLDSIKNLNVGEALVPSYDLILPSGYEVTQYYWSFGNDTYSCDPSPSVAYDLSGAMQLLLNVEVVNNKDTLYLCDEAIVQVGSTDPSGGQIEDVFNRIPLDSRFLNSPITYQLLSKEGENYFTASASKLEPQTNYLILVYQGNRYMISEEFTGGTVDEISTKMTVQAQALAAKEPEIISSIIFDLNEADFSRKNKKALSRNAEILQELPFLRINIGSYTHTGGSFDRNRELSLNRGKLINDYLLEEGVSSVTAQIADPLNERTLINTCLTGNCDYEDEALNSRSDFKIIGISIDNK